MKRVYFLLILFVSVNLFSQNKQTSLEFQEQLNKEYMDPKTSPLLPEDLEEFESLDFFPINKELIVRAKFVKNEKTESVQMKTSTSRMSKYVLFGELYFTLKGKAFKLNLYQNLRLSKIEKYQEYLFLPFSDLTNGKSTYIGGRYLDMKIPTSDNVIIDFNKAYNPYCAYNYEYSCPKVPLENQLDIAILAGVKKFHD